ncbi:translocator protein [Mobula hypostoma]|uniref:translocator protein n=1 Tax=Mobula hypostoma TaxID=723540 RepID=UPI002FC33437
MAPVWAQIAGFATFPHVGGFLGWYVTRSQVTTWYESLKKPSWCPPNKAFPVAWTALYTGMGYASYLVWKEQGGFTREALAPLGIYGIQLALNWTWTPIFFGAHRLKLALANILCLDGAVIATMVSWYPINRTATLLMAPYLAWLTLASCLTYCIWRDNPEKKTK